MAIILYYILYLIIYYIILYYIIIYSLYIIYILLYYIIYMETRQYPLMKFMGKTKAYLSSCQWKTRIELGSWDVLDAPDSMVGCFGGMLRSTWMLTKQR